MNLSASSSPPDNEKQCALEDLVFDTTIVTSTVTQEYQFLCGRSQHTTTPQPTPHNIIPRYTPTYSTPPHPTGNG